jgi:hypothetical protein
MSLIFAYKLWSSPQPVATLGGRWVRPRPVVSVTLVGLKASRVQRALLDTGADDCVFPESLAALLGIDLANAPLGSATGVGSGPIAVRYAQVMLRLTDGREFREWHGWVGFTAARLAVSLLGFAGCLQFFGAHFRGDREEVELTVNALYPGT